MPKPSVLVTLPPSLFAELFTPEAVAALHNLAEVTLNPEERNWSSAELAERIAGHDGIVTGWGTPTFTGEVLDAADHLRVIAHSAGSIKAMLPPAVFDRGLTVTHAASAIAPAVAEMSLLLILLLLRRPHEHDRLLKSGELWPSATLGMGQELAGLRVGVVGAGYTGRCAIKLLRAMDAEVWVYDPYLPEARAAELGVNKVALDDLFHACPVVTVQAPPTEETFHMIGGRELGLLQDGAIFVNTARSWVVDYDALLAELQSGRIRAALDVYDREPLPADSPFRALDNVLLTPHIAGASQQARRRQGQTVVDELERFFAKEPIRYTVTRDMLSTMA